MLEEQLEKKEQIEQEKKSQKNKIELSRKLLLSGLIISLVSFVVLIFVAIAGIVLTLDLKDVYLQQADSLGVVFSIVVFGICFILSILGIISTSVSLIKWKYEDDEILQVEPFFLTSFIVSVIAVIFCLAVLFTGFIAFVLIACLTLIIACVLLFLWKYKNKDKIKEAKIALIPAPPKHKFGKIYTKKNTKNNNKKNK